MNPKSTISWYNVGFDAAAPHGAPARPVLEEEHARADALRGRAAAADHQRGDDALAAAGAFENVAEERLHNPQV